MESPSYAVVISFEVPNSDILPICVQPCDDELDMRRTAIMVAATPPQFWPRDWRLTVLGTRPNGETYTPQPDKRTTGLGKRDAEFIVIGMMSILAGD